MRSSGRMPGGCWPEVLPAEVDAYAEERDENGRRLVVDNGHHQPREVMFTLILHPSATRSTWVDPR